MFQNEEIDQYDEFRSLMEEPSNGVNHGRRRRVTGSGWDEDGPESESGSLEVDGDLGFRADGGYSIVHNGHGGTRGNPGGNVVHEDEYVDSDVLRHLALDEFGFSQEALDLCYTKATASHTPQQLALRAQMDARMLEIQQDGGNIQQFCRAIGLSRSTVDRAIARARGTNAA